MMNQDLDRSRNRICLFFCDKICSAFRMTGQGLNRSAEDYSISIFCSEPHSEGKESDFQSSFHLGEIGSFASLLGGYFF
jgi:hypothetical protein